MGLLGLTARAQVFLRVPVLWTLSIDSSQVQSRISTPQILAIGLWL